MSEKERHHYLSQFYLNGFGENGLNGKINSIPKGHQNSIATESNN